MARSRSKIDKPAAKAKSRSQPTKAKQPARSKSAATPKAKRPATSGGASTKSPKVSKVPATAESWAKIDAWFAAHPEFQPALRPGASEQAIAAAEATLGVTFPDDFRASLAIHDGQDDTPNCTWLPVAYRLGSLESLVRCWQDDRQFFDESQDHGLDDGDRVRVHYNHPKHIPIAGSQYWDYDRLLLDLAPGPKGSVGQVIGRMDIELEVVAPSFAALLAKAASGLPKSVELVE